MKILHFLRKICTVQFRIYRKKIPTFQTGANIHFYSSFILPFSRLGIIKLFLV